MAEKKTGGDVTWIKIVIDVFEDEKIRLIETMPDADSIIVIWFKLLCIAGKSNKNGLIMLNDKIPYTDEMLSTIFRRPLNTIRLALNLFEKYGMIERFKETISISNWDKHQNAARLEGIREYNREAKRKEREQKRLLISQGNVIDSQGTDIEEEIDIDKEYKDMFNFEEFWNLYPKKQAKSKAMSSFKNIVKSNKIFELIKADLIRRQDYYDWQKEDGKYIPLPTTYLNQKRWEDEYEINKNQPKQSKQVRQPDIDETETATDEEREQLRAELQLLLKGDSV